MTIENQINKKRKCKFCRKTITDKRLIPICERCKSNGKKGSGVVLTAAVAITINQIKKRLF